jgi:dihydrofolate reductase
VRLTVHTFLTVDGVMQGPGAADEDASGGFTRGGWLVPYADEDMGAIVDDWFARAGAILLGRTTFEMMRDYWTQVTDPDNPVGVALNGLPKYLASRTVTEPGWAGTTLLQGDVVEAVAALKEKPGDELQVHGSGQLVRALHAAGLVDELRLLVFPVAVGQGKRLFTEDAPPTGFDLVEQRRTRAGAVYSALRPAPFQAADHPMPEDGRATF